MAWLQCNSPVQSDEEPLERQLDWATARGVLSGKRRPIGQERGR